MSNVKSTEDENVTETSPMCHCGHTQFLHATNNECLVLGCPCKEGFQPLWMTISPRLKAALEAKGR